MARADKLGWCRIAGAILFAGAAGQPVRAWNFVPPGQLPAPALLTGHCHYLGSGVTASGTHLKTEQGLPVSLYGASMVFQCREEGLADNPARQKAYVAAATTYAEQAVYRNADQGANRCTVINFMANAVVLSARPDDEQPYLYPSGDLLVQYHGSFMCRDTQKPR